MSIKLFCFIPVEKIVLGEGEAQNNVQNKVKNCHCKFNYVYTLGNGVWFLGSYFIP